MEKEDEVFLTHQSMSPNQEFLIEPISYSVCPSDQVYLSNSGFHNGEQDNLISTSATTSIDNNTHDTLFKLRCNHPNCKRKSRGGNIAVNGSKFCIRHKCTDPACMKQAIRNTALCTAHGNARKIVLQKCIHPNCKRRKDHGNVVAPDSRYCFKHKCIDTACVKLALRGTKRCTFHAKVAGIEFPPKGIHREHVSHSHTNQKSNTIISSLSMLDETEQDHQNLHHHHQQQQQQARDINDS